jgi:ArsR family transcriptional regulator, arsenate/arsenite/antimonite-responsive transcriptional repressor
VLESIQPKISRHLSLLRKSGLVLDERRGQWVYYRLSGRLKEWMKQVLMATLEDLKNSEPYQTDCKKLAAVRDKISCD